MKFVQYIRYNIYNDLQIIMVWHPRLTNTIKIMSNPLFLKFQIAISTQEQRLASSKHKHIDLTKSK